MQLDFQPVSMDFYTSGSKPPKQRDDAEVKECIGFVVIVGHLYGSSPEGEQKSFTELEYEVAIESGMKVYPFLASDKFPLSSSLREDDATHQKLQAFRKLLKDNHIPGYFDNDDQLCAKVASALPKPTEKAGRLTVPKIPQPYLAHPYPLQENFTGRLKERAMLTEWVRDPQAQPILSLIGMGGLGKSALTWFWLHEDLPQEKLKFSGVVWWSFYEQKAGFEAFLRHALQYASGGTIAPEKLPSDYDRMQYLWCILRDSPFLVILDGTERLLRAYHTLDAAYKGDDFKTEAGDNHLRCFDPRAGQFLQWLATPHIMTRTLLTTRLHPKELQGLAGCHRQDLKRLDPEDAVEFMHRQGIKGPRTAIVRACKPYDFLPLCLRLLSGAIREDPQKPNDIDAAETWHPPADLVAHEHHILQIAYDTMAKDRRNLLSRIAAMRGPVDYETARVLSTYDDENKLKVALSELVARGLLFRQKDQPHYDLHPIVRQYAYDRLGDKKAAHTALKDYFAAVPEPSKIENLDDLLPTIELFHHTIRTDAYEEAYRVYRERLTNPLYFQLGAYDVDISLKTAFFPDGEDHPPRLKDESDQAWILNDLSATYYKTGQIRKALGLVERSITIDEKLGKKGALAVDSGNLALNQMLLGELKQAESNIRRRLDISQEIQHERNAAFGHEQMALLHAYLGRYDQSLRETQKALGLFANLRHEQMQGATWSESALRALLMDKPESALQALDKARRFWEKWRERQYPTEPDLVMILWLSGAAKRYLNDFAGAEVDLNDVLSRCRRIRLVELEANILLEIAKLHWQKANGKDSNLIEQAKSLTREALEIANRCEYRLQQADIHNFLAEMALAENDEAAVRRHAEIAKERALCDGPPYCYKKALDEAEQILGNLRGR